MPGSGMVVPVSGMVMSGSGMVASRSAMLVPGLGRWCHAGRGRSLLLKATLTELLSLLLLLPRLPPLHPRDEYKEVTHPQGGSFFVVYYVHFF